MPLEAGWRRAALAPLTRVPCSPRVSRDLLRCCDEVDGRYPCPSVRSPQRLGPNLGQLGLIQSRWCSTMVVRRLICDDAVHRRKRWLIESVRYGAATPSPRTNAPAILTHQFAELLPADPTAVRLPCRNPIDRALTDVKPPDVLAVGADRDLNVHFGEPDRRSTSSPTS